MAALERVETLILRAAVGLPERLQRRLAGRPVVRDGQTLDVDVQLMLRLQRVAREPGAETLPVPEGRAAVLRHARMAGGHQPIGAVRNLTVADRPARLYVPTVVEEVARQPSPSVVEEVAQQPSPSVVEEVAQQPSPSVVEEVAQQPSRNHPAPEKHPLLLFFHGGGFMYGDLDSHDASCRFLAERAGVRILAVDYRLAPEHRFPAAYDDAVAAYRWLVDHAAEVGADPERLAVGGDSAGGNLAAGVAIEAARAGLPLAFQLLVYPATDAAHETPSAEMFSDGYYLTQAFMDLANARYLPDADLRDPRVSPRYADLPAGLAPAFVVTAGFDPLRDEGEAYARQLLDAGVEVELQRFPGQIHGFLNLVGAGRSAPAANALIAAKLRAALRPSLVE